MDSSICKQAKLLGIFKELLIAHILKKSLCMLALCMVVILTGCSGEGDTQPVSPPAIVFTSDRISYEEPKHENLKYIPEIYLMNLDGTEVVRLTKTIGPESNAVWSADGKKIAYDFDTLEEDTKTGVFVMDANGENKGQK